jgi:lipopolysaccharide export system permease protein
MLANLLPEYMGLAVPIGLQLGVLLAFRRLALSSELDALRAVGVGYGRLLRVPYAIAALLVAVNFLVVGFVQPRAEYGYQNLQHELRSGALGASIRVGEFTEIGDGVTLRVDRSEENGNRLQGVFVRAVDRSGRSLAVTAEMGTFLASDDSDVMLLRLTNGRLVHDEPGFAVPRVLSFVQHDLPIDLPSIRSFRRRGAGAGVEELSLTELAQIGNDPATDPMRANALIANFHFRLVQVAMLLLLPLQAVALAVPPKRSTSGLGIILSLALVVAYFKICENGEERAALGRADPELAIWLPFLGFAILIGWMFWTLAYRPGGQPIGALERAFDRAGKAIVRLVRRDAATAT